MRKLKAQQITEFMLAAPLLILFFVVLTEFAFAFNSNVVFSNAVKSSISAYMSGINADFQRVDYENLITNYVRADMENNKIPNLGSMKIKLVEVEKYPVVVGSYTYVPGFAFTFLPALRNININIATLFPIGIQDNTGYEEGILTEELDLIQPVIEPEPGGGV